MTTTNALSTMLQNYYRSKAQVSSTATGAGQSTTGTTASAAAKVDSATISNDALRAYLASEMQRLDNTDPFAMADTSTSSTQQNDGLGSLMSAYTDSIDQQIAQTIQAAQARMLNRSKG